MKRIISSLVILLILMSGLNIYAANNSITYEEAKKQLLSSSSGLRKQRLNTYKAQIQYDNAVKNNESLSIDDIKKGFLALGGKLSTYDEMNLLKQRDFTPSQMKYYWELSQNSEIIMQNTLVLNLRETYVACLNAENDLGIKQQRLDSSLKLENQSRVKLKSGLISQINADEVSNNLLKAQKDLECAIRNRENSVLALNSFIGTSIKVEYNKFSFIEEMNKMQLNSVDYYVEQALKNRMELSDLQKQIDLKKLEIKVMEVNRVNEIYFQARIDYGSLVNGAKSLEAKVIQTRSDIETEIRNGYSDIKKAKEEIMNAKKAIATKERKLTLTKAQYQAGKISDLDMGELQIELYELKNTYNVAIYNYNTKILKLVSTTGFGPKY